MLYDNGQLAQTYLDAYRATGDVRYARVARGILDYLHRDMTHPEGGFYSAEVRRPPAPLVIFPKLAACFPPFLVCYRSWLPESPFLGEAVVIALWSAVLQAVHANIDLDCHIRSRIIVISILER
jgi:hypothetical protein